MTICINFFFLCQVYLLKMFSYFVIKILSLVVVVVVVLILSGLLFLVKSLCVIVGFVMRVITIVPCCLLSSNDL